jgi:outer membrane protein OmpA-like peptidoglycan-associated protein
MTCRPCSRYLSLLGLILFTGLLAAGCAMREPPALSDINQARECIAQARSQGMDLGKVADLDKRLLQARGVYYACQDAEASRLAQAICNDARMRQAAPPPPPPANRPPRAQIAGPNETEVNVLLNLSGEGSSDPDKDPLTYKWDFGDGTTGSFTFPNATHRYAKVGNYTVRLTVDDGKGGTDTATKTIVVIRKVVLQEQKGKVLFDFDKATLKPAGQKELAEIAQEMKDNPTETADLVGHADGIGTDAYNDRLSQRRAEAVRNFLVSQGNAASRFRVAWKGKREPIAPNTTVEGRALNRRVEITLRPAAQ